MALGGGVQRLACELADLFNGVAAQAGMVAHETDDVVSPCEPSRPINVLQYHGTADEVIPYHGGSTLNQSMPSAVESVVRCARPAHEARNA
jgi:polyhydroxybutyrate depolymerase